MKPEAKPTPLLWQEYNEKLNEQIKLFQEEATDLATKAKKCRMAARTAIQTLSIHTQEYEFPNKTEEVHFYKEIRPTFLAQFLYWDKIWLLEINRPIGQVSDISLYFQNELGILKKSFDETKFIYQYLRSGATHLDEKWFFRPDKESILAMDMPNIEMALTYPTCFDHLVARIKANDLLVTFFTLEMTKLTMNPILPPDDPKLAKPLIWTDSKTGLIELAYSLHAAGSFNNGKADLKKIMDSLQTCYHVDLGNTSRTFQEILSRKKGYVTFLDRLRNALLKKMENDI